MTATAVPETATTAATTLAPRRRTYRLLVPLGLAVLLIVTTLVLRAVDRPDADEPGFLSPVATDDDGASRLAEALRTQGVAVRRETDLTAALRTAGAQPSTLFVPAPGLVHPELLDGLTALPPGSRLVLVEPSRRVLAELDTPVEPAGGRWAAPAGCGGRARSCSSPRREGRAPPGTTWTRATSSHRTTTRTTSARPTGSSTSCGRSTTACFDGPRTYASSPPPKARATMPIRAAANPSSFRRSHTANATAPPHSASRISSTAR